MTDRELYWFWFACGLVAAVFALIFFVINQNHDTIEHRRIEKICSHQPDPGECIRIAQGYNK